MIRIAILGGGHVGVTLANHLDDLSEVVVLDPDPVAVERAENSGLNAHETDVTSAQDLDRHDLDGMDIVVIASDSDSANLLTAQLLRVRFGVERIVVRINDPRNVDSFEELDVETVCATSTFADALRETFDADENHGDTTRRFA